MSAAGLHGRAECLSSRRAHRHRAPAAMVMRTYQGSLARCDPSSMMRRTCARVSRPNTAPVVMTYAFIGLPRGTFQPANGSRRTYTTSAENSNCTTCSAGNESGTRSEQLNELGRVGGLPRRHEVPAVKTPARLGAAPSTSRLRATRLSRMGLDLPVPYSNDFHAGTRQNTQ